MGGREHSIFFWKPRDHTARSPQDNGALRAARNSRPALAGGTAGSGLGRAWALWLACVCVGGGASS